MSGVYIPKFFVDGDYTRRQARHRYGPRRKAGRKRIAAFVVFAGWTGFFRTGSICLRIDWFRAPIGMCIVKRLVSQAYTRLTWFLQRSIISRFAGGVPERSKGTDCKSVGSAFEGSNPSPSTRSNDMQYGGMQGQGAECAESLGPGGRKLVSVSTRVRRV